jgi:rubrerythrin
MKVKVPFGLRDGVLEHVQDVPNGNKCGCVCPNPNCGVPLQAKNNPKNVKVPHFAHAEKTNCTYNGMSDLHIIAQRILLESRKIATPAFMRQPTYTLEDGSKLVGKEICIPSQTLEASAAYMEYQWEGFTPDIAFEVGEKLLFIEIAVTHFVEEKKKNAVKSNGAAMIEIDLSCIDHKTLFNKSELESLIIEQSENSYWINNPKGEELYKESMEELKAKAAIKNTAIVQKEQKAKAAKKKREMDFEKLREAKREPFLDDLKSREEAQNSSWRKQRESYLKSLSNRDVALNTEAFKVAKKQRIIDIYDENDWIFNSYRADWQLFIITDILIPHHKKSSKLLNVNDIKKMVVSKFGIINFMESLNIEKQEQKRIGLEKGKNYQDYGAWFFSKNENKQIISPYSPVNEYIKHLSRYGFIELYKSDFKCLYKSINDYQEFIEKETLKYKIRKEEHKKLAAEEEQRRILENVKILKDKQKSKDQREQENTQRINTLIAADKRLWDKAKGVGFNCNNCKMALLESDRPCPFCKHTVRSKYEIDSHHLTVAEKKYQSFTAPRSSLVNAPLIDTECLENFFPSISDIDNDEL